jgi:ferredoxin
MSSAISVETLRGLVDQWLAEGRRVIGAHRVKPDMVFYGDLASSAELVVAPDIKPVNSVKEAVFPRHEPLYRYRLAGKQIELSETSAPVAEQIVFAARPCDAAALAILDHVFNWDFRDELYNARRARTTVLTFVCQQPDAHCFCTAVGSGPEDPRGSDVLLYDLGDGTCEVRAITEKGQRLLADHVQPSSRTGTAGPAPAVHLDLESVRTLLAADFEWSGWAEATLRCLGCGACTYSCPTCHCFDVVDEGHAAGGARVRNWDACQFALFTLHASGHNPRASQWQRQRQRIYHKFHIYPEKFGTTLCTGCGNCSRQCPVGLGVLPVLQAIQLAARQSDVQNRSVSS